MAQPRCWKCGYDLAGLRVEDACPECGTPVWSAPPGPAPTAAASRALSWGIASLVLFFVCLGPLAGLVAIPAILEGRRALAAVRAGRVTARDVRDAKTGLACASLAAALSVALVAYYAVRTAGR